MVQSIDIAFGDLQKLIVGEMRILIVARGSHVGRIDLQDETRLADRLIFGPQCFREGLHIGVLVLVIGIRHEFGQHAGRRGIHEGIDRLHGGDRGFQIRNVLVERRAVVV
jgi:hypothetical protein